VSDINTAMVDSLKVLDLKRPIREADITFNCLMSANDPKRTSLAFDVARGNPNFDLYQAVHLTGYDGRS
jgi:hypothetical protein